VSGQIEEKVPSEEEIIGEQLSKEYIEKVDFKKSAEVKMFGYVLVAAAILLIVAVVYSKFAG
jgi:hypothetical protein